MIYILSCIPPQKWANLAAPADKEGPFKHQVRNPLNIVGGGGVLPWHSSKAKQNKTKFYKKVNGNNICPKRCFFCYRYILDTFFFFFLLSSSLQFGLVENYEMKQGLFIVVIN